MSRASTHMPMTNSNYLEKPEEYFLHTRREIADEVPFGKNKVLEVGCAGGATGAALKAEGRADWVVGIELMEEAARHARQVLDQVLVGNLEQMDLPFSSRQFDAIICGDVLEHMVDPWAALRRLTGYLKPQGLLIACLPNVRNWRVLAPLLFRGRWQYEESGILDRTHLRFFTRLEMIGLLESCDLAVQKVLPLGKKSIQLSKLHLSFLSELTAVQYVVVGKLRQ